MSRDLRCSRRAGVTVVSFLFSNIDHLFIDRVLQSLCGSTEALTLGLAECWPHNAGSTSTGVEGLTRQATRFWESVTLQQCSARPLDVGSQLMPSGD